MKEIATRAWYEPAVLIGLLTTIALVIITVATGSDWDASVIVGVLAPLVSALGIRELVTPTVKVDEVLETYTAPPPHE